MLARYPLALTLPLILGAACGKGGGGGGADAGIDRDAGPPLAILNCQAPISIIRSFDLALRDELPLYNGKTVASSWDQTFDLSVHDRVGSHLIFTHNQADPFGIDPDKFLDVGGFEHPSDRISAAPDNGDCFEERPFAFTASLKSSSGLDLAPLLARVGDGISLVATKDQAFAGSTIRRFNAPQMDACEGLGVEVELAGKETKTVIGFQDHDGAPLLLALDPATIEFPGIEPHGLATLVRWFVDDKSLFFFGEGKVGEQTQGQVLARQDLLTGDLQCIASSGLANDCSIQIDADEFTIDDWTTDGATTALLLRSPAEHKILMRSEASSENIEFKVGEDLGESVVLGLRQPLLCPSDKSVYFVITQQDDHKIWDEVARLAPDGSTEILSHFGALLEEPELAGTVPDTIKDLALSHRCDLVMYTWGQDYQGLWARWADGTQARIFDEIPNSKVQVNGVEKVGQQVRIALGGNAHDGRPTAIDHKGHIAFIMNFADGGSAYAIAEKPAFGCHEPSVVNSVGDSGDRAAGDGSCDTGSTVGSDPECTLRAAIEEANGLGGDNQIEFAIEGLGPHVIVPTTPLPEIRSPLTLQADAAQIVLEGTGVSSGSGLLVGAGPVSVIGLTIRDFPQHGVEASAAAELSLDQVVITGNCGWGVHTPGTLRITGTEAEPSELRNNGAGDGCLGGGLVASPPDESNSGVRLSDLVIANNNGPGVLASSVVYLEEVSIIDNQGDGVAVGLVSGDFHRARIRGLFRPVTISGNRGYGIYSEAGGVTSGDVPWTISGNGNAGLMVQSGRVKLGSTRPSPRTASHVVSGNGVGSNCRNFILSEGPTVSFVDVPCGGGGIAILNQVSENESHVFDLIEIKNNQGPGLVASDSVKANRVDIEGNRGPGIATLVDPNEAIAFIDTVTMSTGPSRIVDNLGDGIFIEFGGLSISAETLISGNAGRGIHVSAGNIGIPSGAAPSPFSKSVTDNGQVGATCSLYQIAQSGNSLLESSETCVTGGIRTGDGDVEGQELIVTGNAGPGIETLAGDEGSGNVSLVGGQLCANNPDLVVAGTQSLSGVNQTCP